MADHWPEYSGWPTDRHSDNSNTTQHLNLVLSTISSPAGIPTMCLLRTALTNTSRSSAVSVSAVRSFTTTRTALAQSSAEKDPQLGDYPQLPYVSLQSRKWSPKWWDPQEKRNYGETVSRRALLSGLPASMLVAHCVLFLVFYLSAFF